MSHNNGGKTALNHTLDHKDNHWGAYIDPSANVSAQAHIGAGTRVWHGVQIREGATLGTNCIVGKDAYVDADVRIGNNVKIQNAALIYHGATLEDGVFVGPQACITNDRYPRAITPEGALKGNDDWQVSATVVRYGASLGAASVIVAGVEIGRFAMVGAGAVVTRNVPAHALVLGVPARIAGYVCACGAPLQVKGSTGTCPVCGRTIQLSSPVVESVSELGTEFGAESVAEIMTESETESVQTA